MGRKLGKKARKKLIIENLQHTIDMGGNPINIEKLKEILEQIKSDTFVSAYSKRAKRRPVKKKEDTDENKEYS
jgi:arsenate reductase-like glutaredoxin family protein|tara:strand:- start:667 stop:885 length:219 start_codon:yes stop_codon:yes gene_type:complete